jgi:hypothetical protein
VIETELYKLNRYVTVIIRSSKRRRRDARRETLLAQLELAGHYFLAVQREKANDLRNAVLSCNYETHDDDHQTTTDIQFRSLSLNFILAAGSKSLC